MAKGGKTETIRQQSVWVYVPKGNRWMKREKHAEKVGAVPLRMDPDRAPLI